MGRAATAGVGVAVTPDNEPRLRRRFVLEAGVDAPTDEAGVSSPRPYSASQVCRVASGAKETLRFPRDCRRAARLARMSALWRCSSSVLTGIVVVWLWFTVG